MKDVVNWAKIWMDNFPGNQHFPLETLLKGWIIGNVRKNCFQGNVDALQKAVLHLIDFAHTPFCDETDNDEAIDQDLARLESPCSCRG